MITTVTVVCSYISSSYLRDCFAILLVTADSAIAQSVVTSKVTINNSNNTKAGRLVRVQAATISNHTTNK